MLRFINVVLLTVAVCTCMQASAAEPEGSGTKPAKAVRILFVSQSAGYKHTVVKRKSYQLSPAERAMTELGIESGTFRITTTQDVKNEFNRASLDAHDIIMFYTTGDLPIEKEVLDYFLNDWLKQKGHGFIGVHSATDTFKDFEPYWEMIGGTFDGHPWNHQSKVTITVHEPEHPICKPWGNEFTITDEIYQFKHWQPKKVRVLMSLNMAKTDLKKPYHVPIAWCKEYGKGRVFNISLGHREDVWTNPTYMQSLLGGVKWILGQEEGEATPNPEVSALQYKLSQEAVK